MSVLALDSDEDSDGSFVDYLLENQYEEPDESSSDSEDSTDNDEDYVPVELS